jgi:hypothetical protein
VFQVSLNLVEMQLSRPSLIEFSLGRHAGKVRSIVRALAEPVPPGGGVAAWRVEPWIVEQEIDCKPMLSRTDGEA